MLTTLASRATGRTGSAPAGRCRNRPGRRRSSGSHPSLQRSLPNNHHASPRPSHPTANRANRANRGSKGNRGNGAGVPCRPPAASRAGACRLANRSGARLARISRGSRGSPVRKVNPANPDNPDSKVGHPARRPGSSRNSRRSRNNHSRNSRWGLLPSSRPGACNRALRHDRPGLDRRPGRFGRGRVSSVNPASGRCRAAVPGRPRA
jgi:hypothetical protein